MFPEEKNTLLLGSHKDTMMYVVDPTCGAQLFAFKSNSPSQSGTAVVPNTDKLVALQHNKLALNIWMWSKDAPVYKCHIAEKMGPLVTTSCGTFCIAGSLSGKLYIWDVASGELINVWDAHYKALSALSLTSDDSFIVSGGEDGVINVWRLSDVVDISPLEDRASLQIGITPVHSWTDHTLPITSIYCGFGGINGRIISSSLDRTCKIWDIPSGDKIYSITCPSNVNVCTMDVMETRLFMGCGDGQIYVLDMHSAASSVTAKSARIASTHSQSNGENRPWSEEPLLPDTFIGHERAVTALCVSECGQYLISGCEAGSVRVWDIPSRQTLRSIMLVQGPVTTLLLCRRSPHLFQAASNAEDIGLIAPFKKYMKSSSA